MKKHKIANTTIFVFPNNHNVVGAVITLEEEYPQYAGLEVEVKYAINGVITDPISLGKQSIGDKLKLDINAEIPTAASHIYVIAPMKWLNFQKF